MADLQQQFSIVVVGTMNPAIHHPFWYEQNGFLSGEERQEALLGTNLIVAPMVAQFSWRAWTLVCAGERWEMRTADARKFDRVLEVAVSVFDRLRDTPVTAFGINLDRVESLAGEVDVPRALVDAFARTGLGTPATASSASFSFNDRIERDQTVLTRTVTVTTSAEHPLQLRVANNFHHDIAIKGAGFFDLTPLLRDGARDALQDSEIHTASIANHFPWRNE